MVAGHRRSSRRHWTADCQRGVSRRSNTSVSGATLGSGPTSLLDANRTALIVYANPDDQLTGLQIGAGGRRGGNLATLLIAPLGVGLIGAGYLLRRRARLTSTGPNRSG